MQLVVGRVLRPHGLRGELAVEVRTDVPETRFADGSVLATEPASRGPLTVSSARWHLGRLLVSFDGYADRTRADELRGTLLVMDSEQAGPAEPGEYHDHQLVGLDVLTVSGDRIGVVTDVLHHGQDLLVVTPTGEGRGAATGRPASGGETSIPRGGAQRVRVPAPRGEILVPFVAAIVPEVDVAAGRLVIDPPPGLIDPDEAL
jgi:16S rRNA processing protein RimM